MIDQLIQLVDKNIKENNKENKGNSEKIIKNGITLYAKPKQVILWLVFGLITINIGFIAVLGFGEKNMDNMNCVTRWFFIALGVLVLLLTVFLTLAHIFSKQYLRESLNEGKKRLDVVKDSIKEVYGADSLQDKVEALITYYQEEVDRIGEQEKKNAKFVMAVISFFGTATYAFFDKLKEFGISLELFLMLVMCLVLIGALIAMIFYLAKTIYSQKDQYVVMISRLKDLRLMIMADISK